MSSTLFARGTNTQVGLRRRAEEINKNISDIRSDLEAVKSLPLEFRVMRTRMEAVETHNETIAVLTRQISDLDALVEQQKARIVNLETTLMKQNRELGDRISMLEAKTAQKTVASAAAPVADTPAVEETSAPAPIFFSPHIGIEETN